MCNYPHNNQSEDNEGELQCTDLGGVEDNASRVDATARLFCITTEAAQQNAWDCLTDGMCDEAVRAEPWIRPVCGEVPVVCEPRIDAWGVCRDELEYMDCAQRRLERIRLCWELTCDPVECEHEVLALEEVCGRPPQRFVERFESP